MNFEKFSLKNQTALITGGAGLLGFAHATSILECSGKVLLVDLNEENLRKTKKELSKEFSQNDIEIFICDVRTENEVSRLHQTLKNSYPQILINNAAINSQADDKNLNSNFDSELDFNNWKLEIEVGLTGAFLMTKYFGGEMAKSGGGVILNIASDLSVISPNQNIYKNSSKRNVSSYKKPVGYSVVKHGIIGLTKYFATYWSEQGVRVNALSPGGIKWNQSDDFVKRIQQLIPLGRMADRMEYTSAVQFLCSSASSYMTGHNLIMDGGRSIW